MDRVESNEAARQRHTSQGDAVVAAGHVEIFEETIETSLANVGTIQEGKEIEHKTEGNDLEVHLANELPLSFGTGKLVHLSYSVDSNSGRDSAFGKAIGAGRDVPIPGLFRVG